MLIDDITIRIRAGHGGRGAVAFDKNKMAIGPTGAAGGKGGSIYLEGVSDIGALRHFRFTKEVAAANGEDGRSQFRDGHDGEDLVIKVPVGTTAHNLLSGVDYDILKIGERVRIARGGNGGKGNFHFRSPINTSPKEFQHGLSGDEFDMRFELKLIADVGLIGYPNAGKSSLLNMLTAAKAKVGNYRFTTLEPNLGAYYDLVLADLPGLIEGASEGKGLGMKFLRHIERTRVLFHLVSAESDNPVRDYLAIREELGKFNKELLYKPEYVFLSKSDMADEAALKKHLSALKKASVTAQPLSVIDDNLLDSLKKVLNKIAEDKKAK